jgi:hypothetical protein
MITLKSNKKGPEGPSEIVPHPLGSITSPQSRKEVSQGRTQARRYLSND